jgi:hypothetical protein
MPAVVIARSQVERYVGLRYESGRFDCADLAQQVQRELFGRAIHLPQDRPRSTSLGARAREVLRLRPAVAARRASAAEWTTGDGVLLSVGTLAVHIGVLFHLAGEWWVLHNDHDSMQSVLTRLRDAAAAGFNIEGVYAWLEPATA